MPHSLRQPEILEVARQEGKVTVDDLASRFGVTVQTIRRDLSELCDAGRLNRVHGGAILPTATVNIDYEDRRALNASAKQVIARACAAEIPHDCTVFLGIGTSVEAVARALVRHRNLVVITNNVNVAQIMMGFDLQLVVTGGVLRQADGGLVGPLTSACIRNFKFDVAVISCSALDMDGDLLDFDVLEVEVSRAIIDHARRTYLVADRSKFLRTAPARIASMAELDTVFTDHVFPASLGAACSEWDTEIRIAE